MKSTILVFGLLILSMAVYGQQTAQQNNETILSISELQANEFCSHYNLDDVAKQKAIQINEQCRMKIEGLQSTNMEQQVIDEGIVYNQDLRLKSLKKLLTPKQQESFHEFVINSQYNH